MNDDTATVSFGRSLPEAGRPVGRSMSRGMRNTCPACGEGHLFSRYLATEPACPSCGEELHHHRADDLPAYLNIFITGHIVVAGMMILMDAELMSQWMLASLTALAAIVLAGLLMRPLKGMVVGAQWALRMHGFGGHDD